jgi:enoyl-CoA hydratase/carnithine racemase
MNMAQMIAKNSPAAVKAAKKAIDAGLNVPLTEGLMIERKYLAEAARAGDQLEGAKAFLEKRRPNYKLG